MTTDNIKTRIIRDLEGDLLDCNHVTRRFFRCWLDGSYMGEGHYRMNLDFLLINRDKPKALRSWVVSEFVRFTAHDAYCSAGYAQKVIVDTIPRDTLEKLNVALVDDALDLISDEREVA